MVHLLSHLLPRFYPLPASLTTGVVAMALPDDPVNPGAASDVTRLLEAAHRGDKQAAAELLPLVYDELRRLAAAKLAHEKPGQTLDATALVHEAYLRLVGTTDSPRFNNRIH